MQTSYDNKSCQQLMLNTLKHLRSLKLSRFEPIHKCMGQVWSCKKGKKQLETRVIIKILTQPCQPRKFDFFTCLCLVLQTETANRADLFPYLPISFKSKVAIGQFFWKMQRKIWYIFHFRGGRHGSSPQNPVVNGTENDCKKIVKSHSVLFMYSM